MKKILKFISKLFKRKEENPFLQVDRKEKINKDNPFLSDIELDFNFSEVKEIIKKVETPKIEEKSKDVILTYDSNAKKFRAIPTEVKNRAIKSAQTEIAKTMKKEESTTSEEVKKAKKKERNKKRIDSKKTNNKNVKTPSGKVKGNSTRKGKS